LINSSRRRRTRAPLSVGPIGRGRRRGIVNGVGDVQSREESGFTLIELVIVTVVVPLIVGALAIGLMSILSLQTGVSNRLTNSEDSQVTQANFRNDVQSAQFITTNPAVNGGFTGECGTGDQVLGLEWNENTVTNIFQTVVSYVSVPEANGTYALVRQECTNVSSHMTNIEPVTSTSTVSANLAGSLLASEYHPVILPGGSATSALKNWISVAATGTQDGELGVTSVSFPITEPGSSSSVPGYSYNLVATPPASNLLAGGGPPLTATTQAGCGYAAPGSGSYASSLCLFDFSALSGNNMVAARQGCVELAIPLPGGSNLYFCIAISGSPVAPYALPTWTDGFLGNQINGVPFYSDIPGDPALYQSCEGDASTCVVNGVTVPNTWGGVTTINITHITVVSPDGNAATGWEFVSADAESTDSGESIQWTSNNPLYDIANNQSVDTASDPIGNACNSGAGVSGSLTDSQGNTTPVTASQIFAGDPATSITCSGNSNGVKTGTMMVESLQPKTLSITMIGTGLEGISLGLLF
jgi:hypothetical protein